MKVPLRVVIRSGTVVATAAVVLALQGAGSIGFAQGRLDARYTASLAGIPIGRGAWVIDIGDNQYLAAASGATAGILRLFASGEGSGASRGNIVKGQLVPASYAVSIATKKRKNEVRIALKAGTVKEVDVSPPVSPDSGRVPLREAHRRGVSDPMSASLIRVGGNGDPLVSETCRRTVSVFDGRMRYDLKLAYKRMGRVEATKGYAGPALVCAIYFSPIAGHIPDRTAVRYLTQSREMEVWLVPITGTSVLVPYRVSIPTPFGLGVLEATQFVTSAYRTRAEKPGARAP